MQVILRVFILWGCVSAPSAVFADAITGGNPALPVAPASSAESDAANATAARELGAPLFDVTGASLLLITTPQYLNLFEPRDKLRGYGNDWTNLGTAGGGGGVSGGSGTTLIPDGVLAGLGSGVAPGTIGNISLAPGTDPGGGLGTVVPTAVPEPSLLVLMASGLAVGARRWLRDRRGVSRRT